MGDTPIRLAGVLASLALASDLGMGQPRGHALRVSILSVRLAHALGMPDRDIADVFYTALLRYIGCTADAAEVAVLSGDEIRLAVTVAPHVMGSVAERVAHTVVEDAERSMTTAMAIHCEVAGMLGSRLALGDDVTDSLQHGFERWDGEGHPDGLVAERVPRAIRIAVLARDVVVWHGLGGLEAARAMATERRGRAYDPAVVDAFLQMPSTQDESWASFLAAEPEPVRTIANEDLDGLLEVCADFADLKTPLSLGHSRRVAALAAGAGAVMRLDALETVKLRRAGLVHDLGRVGVSSRIWGKASPWNDDEWERVRLHPYLTERILHRCDPLADLATLAGSHHERLDGSGYYRGSVAAALNRSSRVLAAADTYVALRETRPDRAALDAANAVQRMRAEVEAGALDGGAVRAVIAAAGEERPPPVHWPAGLSERELEVLRLAVRGLTIGQVATRLGIAAKTVDRHLQNTYTKIGVSSRAGAALFTLEHGLMD